MTELGDLPLSYHKGVDNNGLSGIVMAPDVDEFAREAEDERWWQEAAARERRPRLEPGATLAEGDNGLAAGLLRAVGRQLRDNPIPFALIGIGVALLALAESPASRRLAASATNSVSQKTAEIAAAMRGVAERMTERASDVSAMAAAGLGKGEWPLTGASQRSVDDIGIRARPAPSR
jgi:hypothetical protein